MCCNVLLCGFNSEQCVPPNVSSDGTFIDGALYAYFILHFNSNMWLQNYQQCVILWRFSYIPSGTRMCW